MNDSPVDCQNVKLPTATFVTRTAVDRPLQESFIFSAGAIHELHVFSNAYRETKPLFVILSEGRRVRPPTEVEVLRSD